MRISPTWAVVVDLFPSLPSRPSLSYALTEYTTIRPPLPPYLPPSIHSSRTFSLSMLTHWTSRLSPPPPPPPLRTQLGGSRAVQQGEARGHHPERMGPSAEVQAADRPGTLQAQGCDPASPWRRGFLGGWVWDGGETEEVCGAASADGTHRIGRVPMAHISPRGQQQHDEDPAAGHAPQEGHPGAHINPRKN